MSEKSKDQEKKNKLQKGDSQQEQGSEHSEAEEVEEAIKKLSDKKPEVVSEFAAMMGMTGSMTNPLHHKMNEKHISKLLEIAADHDEREFTLRKDEQSDSSNDKKSNRRYFLAVFLVVAAILLYILNLFQDKPEILIPTLTGLGGALGGFFGGWGYGVRK